MALFEFLLVDGALHAKPFGLQAGQAIQGIQQGQVHLLALMVWVQFLHRMLHTLFEE